MNLESGYDVYNFGSIQKSVGVKFYGIVVKTEQIGKKEIGIDTEC